MENVPLLTPKEIAIVHDVWKAANKPANNLNEKLLIALLKGVPQLRDFYSIPEGLFDTNADTQSRRVQAEIVKNPRLFTMVSKVQEFLDAAVQALNPTSNVQILKLANTVGVLHFHRGVNLEALNWLIIKGILVSEMDSNDNSAEKEKTNMFTKYKFVTILIREMKYGVRSETLTQYRSQSQNNDDNS